MTEHLDEAREALSDLQVSLAKAKNLVERTRSLLAGQRSYDEGEQAMVVRAGEDRPASA